MADKKQSYVRHFAEGSGEKRSCVRQIAEGNEEKRSYVRQIAEGKEYVVQDGDIMHFLFNV